MDTDESKPKDDIRELIIGQLQMIEAVHGVHFVNRDSIIGKIAQVANDRMQVSIITAALNGWVAINNLHNEIDIHDEVLTMLLTRTRR
ncbi:MAG: hypothetical protein ABR887_07350 [Methanoregulaceae archaeon]|jgi:hypothetical protein